MSGTDSRVPAWSRSHSRGECPRPSACRSPSWPTVRVPRSEATARRSSATGRAGAIRSFASGSPERHGVEPAQVVLTNGSLQGFQFVAELLAPTGPVLVEAPTYDRPLKILASLGAEVIPVPLDEEGTVGLGGVPVHDSDLPEPDRPHPAARPAQAAREAGEGGLLVLEDDPYGLVRFEGKPLPTVFELAGGENVVYSSVVLEDRGAGPSGRLPRPAGGARGPGGVGGRLRVHHAGAPLAGHGLRVPAAREARAEPRARLRAPRERRDAMVAALERHLPEATWTVPEGGYFLWLELPGGVRGGRPEARWRDLRAGTDFFAGAGGESALGSRSATSRPQRSKKACGAWPQPSAPRCSSAEPPSRRRRRYSCEARMPPRNPMASSRMISQMRRGARRGGRSRAGPCRRS